MLRKQIVGFPTQNLSYSTFVFFVILEQLFEIHSEIIVDFEKEKLTQSGWNRKSRNGALNWTPFGHAVEEMHSNGLAAQTPAQRGGGN